MGLDDNAITRVSIGDDSRINDIAYRYLNQSINESQAINEFNAVFASDANLRQGEMTGTDIMQQLKSNADRYRQSILDANISSVSQQNLGVRIELFKVVKSSGPELEASEYNKEFQTFWHRLAKGINNTV